MRIAVIGAGGVGGFLGGVLARAGHDVSFVARGEQLEVIRARGLTVESTELGVFTQHIRAGTDPVELGRHDLVIMAVKLYDFAAAAHLAAPLMTESGLALTFQNGLDAPYDLARVVGQGRVLIGTIAVEAAIREPGVVVQTSPFHRISLSELDGPITPRLSTIVEQLQQAGLSVSAAPDGRQALWDKAAFLIPMATLTSAGDLVVGDIFASPELTQLFDMLSDELALVAKADGCDVTAALNGMRSQLPSLPHFTSSMNRDFRAGRRVELEWLTGAFVRMARQKQIPVPAHFTLYALLKRKAQGVSQGPVQGT